MSDDKKGSVFRRKEDWFLLFYQGLIFAVYLAFFYYFSSVPWWGRISMFYVAAILTTRFEGVMHWSIHSPIFRSNRFNYLHRLTFAFIPPPAIFYRHEHLHHHLYDNIAEDHTTTLAENATEHQRVGEYTTGSMLTPAHFLYFWRQMTSGERHECLLSFGLTWSLAAVLFYFDPYATIFFWIPVTWVLSFMVIGLYNYFDHVPGNPYDEFKLATYRPVETRWEKVLALLDLHNDSYHLTHHRYPSMHWTDIPKLHREWLGEYKRYGSPVTALSDDDFFNPVAFVHSVWEVRRRRQEVAITRDTPTPRNPASRRNLHPESAPRGQDSTS